MELVVYLIKPSKYDDDGYVIRYWRGVLPSNTLACLYGLTEGVRREGVPGVLRWRIELIDETVQRVDVRKILRTSRRRNTKAIVCLAGVQSNQFARASDLALEFRAGGVDVLIGGFHVSGSLSLMSSIPPEIQRLMDAGVTVVAGEIEGQWKSILQDAVRNKLHPVYNFLAAPPDLSAAPAPKISKRYLRRFVAPNFSTFDCGRGCPFNCSFCTVINVQGRKMRFRDVQRFEEMIRENYLRHRISYYFFTDDNFCRNKNWEALFDALIRLRTEEKIGVAFMIQVDTQSYKIPRFVDKAKEAGCSQVFIGMESLNSENLLAAGKRQNVAAEFQEMIAAYRSRGINTHVAYIIGFPFDTAASVRRDLRQLREVVAPEQASFFMLTPLPGSKDHADMVRQGVPLEPDLNRYDTFHATVQHPRMSPGEWQGAYEEAWASFYGMENMKAILQRVPAKNYWRAFTNFIWYKNAVDVEKGHPMIHGFVRLKGRLLRRPGLPVETRWQYGMRRLRDIGHYFRRWPALAMEMEEVWLQTRPRSDLERKVVEDLQRRYADVLLWRNLRQRELQWAYRRAAVFVRRASPRSIAWPRVQVPSRVLLWVRQRNPFSVSLTQSRKPLQQFWKEVRVSFRRGRLHRLHLGKLVIHLTEESFLFLSFAFAFFQQLFPHLFGRVAASHRG